MLDIEPRTASFYFLTEHTIDRLDSAEIETYFGALLNRKCFATEEKKLIFDSLYLAKDVHAEDWRTTGSYIDHPMRVAITALRYFDGADSNTIAACLLHDTIEKNPQQVIDSADVYVNDYDDNSQAFYALEVLTNESVSDIVKSVTNPRSIHRDSNVDVSIKNQIYARHVQSILDKDPLGTGPGVVKFCDYIDNFVKNYKTIGTLQHKLDIKYGGLSNYYRDWLNYLPNSLISEDNLFELNELINQGCDQQQRRLRNIGRPAVDELLIVTRMAI